jgi:hypothetical protein
MGIEVMKLERRVTTGITTQPTTPASLTDKYLLDLAPPPHHGLLPA